MDITNVRFQLTRYRFNTIQLSVPGFDPFAIPLSQIANLYLEKDYENDDFPFFTISVSIPAYLYRAMKANPYQSKMQIDLQAGNFNNDVIGEEKPTFISQISGEFVCYLTDTTPEADSAIQDKIAKDDDTYGKGYSYSDIALVDMLLYKQDMLDRGQTVINDIVSANLTDILMRAFGLAGINKVMLSPPNNTKVYKEFAIEPLPARKEINRICNSYGYHTKGTVVFFDFDHLWVVDKSPSCTVYMKNENKLTYLTSLRTIRTDSKNTSGCFKDTTNKCNLINLIDDSINFDDQSKVQYNNFIHIDSKSGTITNVTGDSSSTATKEVIISSTGDNTSGAYSYAAQESKLILTAGMQFVDLSFLTPNKEFVFSTDNTANQKYVGSYRIVKYSCTFAVEGNYLAPNVVAEFRR